MNNEEDLLRKCQNGKKDAFYQLVHPYLAKSYRTAFALLRRQHEAEDAVQNALLECYKVIMSKDEIRNFQAWFHKLVIHRSIDLARKRIREDQRIENEESLAFLTTMDETPIEQILDKELQDEVISHILKIDIRYRLVVVLYYYNDLSIREIAKLLDMKEGTVKSRLFYARNLLLQSFVAERKEEAK